MSTEKLDDLCRLRNEGQSPAEIHAWLEASRESGILAPNITNVRKALKGQSYR